MRRADVWLRVWQALVGTGVLAWELLSDRLHHWPILVVACWLLGAPLEEMIRMVTSGRIAIEILKPDDEEQPPKPPPPPPGPGP